MNYLNSFLVDREIKERVRANLEFRFEELRVVKFDILEVLLPYLVALLGVENFFSYLKIMKLHENFF